MRRALAQQVKHDEWVGAADDGGDATHDRKRRRVESDDHRTSLCPVTTIAGRCVACVPLSACVWHAAACVRGASAKQVCALGLCARE